MALTNALQPGQPPMKPSTQKMWTPPPGAPAMTSDQFMSTVQGIYGGVSPMGSMDPNYQGFSKLNIQTPVSFLSDEEKKKATELFKMNPMLEDFSNQMGSPELKKLMLYNPHIQAKLFDTDNSVKGNAGIFRKKEEGLQDFGVDSDGKPIYAAPELLNKDAGHWTAGHDQINMTGHVLDSVGAFRTPAEADRFVHSAKISGNPKFMGAISAQIANGDKKGATNSILKQFGKPSLENTAKGKPADVGIAFAVHNLVGSWDKLNPSQRSMMFSGIGLGAYDYDDGQSLSERKLIANDDPDGPELTVGNAMGLASSGVNVPQMMKNWDQLDTIQRITFGKGSSSQMAATAKRFGLLGKPEAGDSSIVGVKAADLARTGFTAAPSAGIGGIIGPADKVPKGYSVVGAGKKQGTVIAVPQGVVNSAATTNGSTKIVSLNQSPDAEPASYETYKVYSKWAKSAPRQNGLVGGTQMAAGLHQSGLVDDPYMRGAISAVSVHANTTPQRPSKSKMNEELVKGARRTAENAVLSKATGGASNVAMKVDEATGGNLNAVRDKVDQLNPINTVTDKLLAKGIGAFDSQFGGKSEDQQGRDHIRGRGVELGLIDKEKWTVTLADGSKADVGMDGKGGQHEFRFSDKVPEGNEVRSLSAYDVDYTNDLDFSANMMSSALVRLFSGGKGKSIDQFAGQLGNSALGGFGQDMNADTFGSVQANIRGFFAQSGVKSKEDAYALMNQGFAEGRFAEMDVIAMQQGINMAFDDNGFDTAQQLMAGRWKGLDVAHDMPTAPGPNFVMPGDPGYKPPAGGIDPGNRPPGTQPDQMEQFPLTPGIGRDDPNWYLPGYVPALELQRNPGYYDGSENSGMYSRQYAKYDAWQWGVENEKK